MANTVSIYDPETGQSYEFHKSKFYLTNWGFDLNIVDPYIIFKIWVDNVRNETVEYPKTWWDHVKQDLFPPILRRLFPPKMVEVKIMRVYPFLDLDQVIKIRRDEIKRGKP